MSRRSVGVILCLLVAVAAAGCGGGSSSGGDGTATVSGKAVDDGTLAALTGAVARIGDRSSSATTSTGRFSLNSVPTGDQTLSLSAPGHVTSESSVTVTAGTDDLGLCYVAPVLTANHGAVTGVMVLASGSKPVSGGSATAGSARATSRSDGRFTLYDVKAGTRLVSFSDLATQSSNWKYVTIADGMTADVGTVTLSQGTPPPPPLTTSTSHSR